MRVKKSFIYIISTFLLCLVFFYFKNRGSISKSIHDASESSLFRLNRTNSWVNSILKHQSICAYTNENWLFQRIGYNPKRNRYSCRIMWNAPARNIKFNQISDYIQFWLSAENNHHHWEWWDGGLSRKTGRLDESHINKVHVWNFAVNIPQGKRGWMAQFIQTVCSSKTLFTCKYPMSAFHSYTNNFS